MKLHTKIVVSTVLVLFVAVWVAIKIAGMSIAPLSMYYFSRLVNGGALSFHSACIQLPDYWWVYEELNTDRLVLARLTKKNNYKTVFLSLQRHDVQKVERVIDSSKAKRMGDYYYITIPSADNGLNDVHWLYPEIGVVLIGFKYDREKQNYAKEIIDSIQQCR
jgi:hypothetical protein